MTTPKKIDTVPFSETEFSDLPTHPKTLLERLKQLDIQTQLFQHPAVFTVEDSQSLKGELPGGDCKSLFCKDKKGQLWLIVMLGDDRLDTKAAEKVIGSARLSFGKPELLFETLGVKPGSVTPFSIINDTENQVKVILQETMMAHELLNYHPLHNTMSCTITPKDLIHFLTEHGHTPEIRDLPLR